MGKHSGINRSKGPVLAAVAAVALAAAGGSWAFAAAGDDPPASSGAPTGSVSATSSTSKEADTVTTPSRTTSTATATASDREDSARVALAQCRTWVVAQERVAGAAAASARDWGAHTGAQLKYDSGQATLAQTQATWARSKAPGPSDVKAFDDAVRAAKSGAGSCAGLAAATTGTGVATKAAACAKRHDVLVQVVATGTKVNAQWAEHITMMAHKEHTDGAAYHDRWVGMVRDAQPRLTAYRTAARALTKAPACAA